MCTLVSTVLTVLIVIDTQSLHTTVDGLHCDKRKPNLKIHKNTPRACRGPAALRRYQISRGRARCHRAAIRVRQTEIKEASEQQRHSSRFSLSSPSLSLSLSLSLVTPN